MNKVERKNIKKKDLNSNIQQIIIYLFFLFDNVLDYYNKGCAFCMEKLLEKTKYKIKNNIIGLQEILKIEESFSLIYFLEKKIIFLEFLLKKNEREEVDIFEKEKFSVIFTLLINYCFLLKNAIKTSFLFKVKIDFLIIEKRVLNELFIVYSKYKVFAKKINPEGVVKIKKFVKKEKKKKLVFKKIFSRLLCFAIFLFFVFIFFVFVIFSIFSNLFFKIVLYKKKIKEYFFEKYNGEIEEFFWYEKMQIYLNELFSYFSFMFDFNLIFFLFLLYFFIFFINKSKKKRIY